MIRIIHLSDFHLNKTLLKDWNSYIKTALLKRLVEINNEKSITLIAFTGDLIDKGGEGFSSPDVGFHTFKKEVVDTIVASIALDQERFFIIPGNHDVLRSLDLRRDEKGLIADFEEEYSHIAEYMDNAYSRDDYSGMERIKPFKEFEKEYYKNVSNSELTIFGNSFYIEVDNKKIGIACLNSSWRCYDSKEDVGRLIVGEEQLNRALKFLNNCEIKIALMHHPIDWLYSGERDFIANHLTKDFNLLLLGHVHESKTKMTTGFTGTLFANIAPSTLNDIRSDSRQYSNGFTLIDFHIKENLFKTTHWRYNHNLKEFVLNTDIGENGVKDYPVPDAPSNKEASLESMLLDNIREDHFKEMDDHLIGSKALNSNLSIKDGFILPPINQVVIEDLDEPAHDLTIDEIVKTKSNLMFFGSQESGKTTLLFRLVREFVDEFSITRKIPVYLDFEEFGNKEIVTVIKEYLRCNSEQAKDLIRQKQLVLLIDNFNFRKFASIDQRNKLNRFNSENEEIQIIATGENTNSPILPPEYVELNKIAFKNYFIKNLRAKEIKCLMRQWLPDENELSSELRLEKLVNNFRSYALPSSVMSVSLFLWSTVYSERKPINHAVLMEIYIEILLEKLGKHNIYRENFDFTNKIQLLAKIAEEMLESDQPNYSILFSEFEGIVEKYLDDVGFNFDANLIVQYFLERKIFLKHQGNRIKFTYSCFFHFFLAKRMVFNPVFKDYILDDLNFYKFAKEIDYYSGLVRSDEGLLIKMHERLQETFKDVENILEDIDIDDYFTEQAKIIDSTKEHEPEIQKVEIAQIQSKRPSPEMVENFFNKKLNSIPEAGTITKKGEVKSLEGMIIIAANVLRNSEGVENRELKSEVYNSLIKDALLWTVLYREYLLNYFLKHNTYPPSFSSFSEFVFTLKNLPLGVQEGINRQSGTAKLAAIILDKIKVDLPSNKSDIEKFFSVALYSDIEGNDFDKYLRSFVKKVGKNIVRDYTYFKLVNYYYRRTRPGSDNEKMYLDLLVDLKMKTKHWSKRLRHDVTRMIEDGKKAFDEKQ